MHIGVPREIKTQEYRVGLIPSSVRELTHHGHTVTVETGAGARIDFTDEVYRAAGATIAPDAAASRLGVTPETLANWRWRGDGPRYVRVGRRVRYRLADLLDYLDRQSRDSTFDGGSFA